MLVSLTPTTLHPIAVFVRPVREAAGRQSADDPRGMVKRHGEQRLDAVFSDRFLINDRPPTMFATPGRTQAQQNQPEIRIRHILMIPAN
jgi:hypothetical protein